MPKMSDSRIRPTENFKLSDGLKRRLKKNGFCTTATGCNWIETTLSASVGRILVSDKTFNIPVVAIHYSNAQNVGFENPTYKIIPSIIL